jgi:excisionase family DNA binding protein
MMQYHLGPEENAMSAAGTKVGTRTAKAAASNAGGESSAESSEVLTSGEAAAYLRVAEAEVLRLANLLELPGRQIGGEWRFLKAALQEWLRTPAQRSGKEAFLALAGAWNDDPDVDQIVREAMQRRGRPAAGNEK